MLELQNSYLPISWDESSFYIDGKSGPFHIGLFDSSLRKDIVLIQLPSNPRLPINWKEPLEKAQNTSLPILWDIDFGLSEKKLGSYTNPLEEKTKLLTVKYFIDKVYPQFVANSVGVILHKANACKEDPLFASIDGLIDHIATFARHLPDTLPIFLLFDVSSLPMSKAVQLLHKTRFSHYVLGLKGAGFSYPGFAWGKGEGSYGKIIETETIGVLVPDHPFEDLLKKLKSISYRLLYKEFANQDWVGLDALVFDEDTPQVRRILQGFQAAGGSIASINGRFGVPKEQRLEDLLAKKLKT